MQSCQFSKSVSESGPGKFSAARPVAVSSAELQYSNHRETLAMVFSGARLRVRLSWRPGWGHFRNFWARWGCAAGSLEPLIFTRASSAEFCYPIIE